jgi:hypothetical protein
LVTSHAVFAGMPDEGLAFLEDLEERNSKEFFDANKQLFRDQVQAPFVALVEAACGRLRRGVPGLGQPKVFRIYRDLRFSKDKTPYKTSMRAWVAHPSQGGVETGYYVDVGPGGMYAGGGRYHWARPELERSPTPTPAGSWPASCAGRKAGAWSRGWTRSSGCPSPTRPTTPGPSCCGPAPSPSAGGASAAPGCSPVTYSTTWSRTGACWSP